MGEAVQFLVGLVLITFGADWLVTGSSRLAARLRISPLVVGLTVVAFGTSAPELFVSGLAALRGQAGLAVGNVMGSTVANVGLIAGLGALIRPIDVRRRLLIRESPLLVLVLLIVMLLSWNDALGRLDGLALLAGFLIYLGFMLRLEGMMWRGAGSIGVGGRLGVTGDEVTAGGQVVEGASAGGEETRWGAAWGSRPSWLLVRMIVGLAALLAGAHWLVDSAVAIATAFRVPEEVIGATMVAVGTSIPELASTVAAAARRLGDIAIGNIIGSNVFNLGLVLGSAALLSPLRLPPDVVVRQVVPALFFCLLLIPLAYTGRRVNRPEGLLLLVLYGVFIYQVI
ncbi:MAG: calcium/sodium antiporter [Acidobacteriota bacterium]